MKKRVKRTEVSGRLSRVLRAHTCRGQGRIPERPIAKAGTEGVDRCSSESYQLRQRNGKLTRATIHDKIRILVFFHHISRLTARAPLLNSVAWPAMTSVLSTSRSILSPRLRICSTFCTMISFTWLSSFCARVSSSTGGAVLKVYINDAITGPKLAWSPYGGVLSIDVDDVGAELNCRWC